MTELIVLAVLSLFLSGFMCGVWVAGWLSDEEGA